MPGHDIMVIGASAGGVEALSTLARGLPADLPAALFVVLHVPATGRSMMPEILSRAGPVPAAHARDGEPIRPGRIYVAPPDHHLLVRADGIGLSRGPRENRHRPAVDTLFRSAALAHGPRVVGVVLSGSLDDGTAGLAAVKGRAGVTVAQDPAEALFDSMPRSAIEHGVVDHVLPVGELGPLLGRLATESPARAPDGAPTPDMEQEVWMAELDPNAINSDHQPGVLSGFSCPECGGTLWELEERGLVRYRCRVGHAYSVDSLLADQDETLDDALWGALRALEEQAALARRLAVRAREHGHAATIVRFARQEEEAARRADVVRRLLLGGHPSRTSVGSTPGADREAAAPISAGGE